MKNILHEKVNLQLSSINRGGVIVSTLTSTTGQNNGQAILEKQPPIPQAYYVQKLPIPLNNGDNMILRIQFYVDSALTDKVTIYNSTLVINTLKDDGVDTV